MPAAILSIAGLSLSRGGRTLFAGFDLAVGLGELVWMRAPNGYGKTTLLRAVAGLVRADAGTITWSGDPEVHYVAHANALKGDLTAAESLAHYARLRRLPADARVIDDALARFGVASRRPTPTRSLSQGQRRRVALACLALAGPASTWILDEPWDALDADGSALVGTLLVEHAAAGGNALFTSHVAPALARAPRIVELDASATR